ncbi:unnamed protein product, partial [Schistocephalus solidus]|uniref:PUL domain-containing protein n=1 Tax=Schistocephalus solidus TaxID=70667 RepID=A0A183SA04_SCHSO
SAKKSSPAAPKKASKPQNPSGKSPAATAEKPKFASLLEALLSADDASTDRHAVWKSANVAMRALIQFVSTEAAEPAPLDAAASLLPVSYTSEDPLEIALFTAASPPPEANTSAMALSESMGEVKVDEKMADDKSGVASLYVYLECYFSLFFTSTLLGVASLLPPSFAPVDQIMTSLVFRLSMLCF